MNSYEEIMHSQREGLMIPIMCPECLCEWDIANWDDGKLHICPDCNAHLKLPGMGVEMEPYDG